MNYLKFELIFKYAVFIISIIFIILFCVSCLNSQAEEWNAKGYDLYLAGSHDEAIKCYDEALKLDPSNAYAWKYKGDALRELIKYDEALKCYEKAIIIAPDFKQAKKSRELLLAIMKK